jgi:hypothetical protein
MGQFVLPDGDLGLQLFQALVGLHQLAVSDSLLKSLIRALFENARCAVSTFSMRTDRNPSRHSHIMDDERKTSEVAN